MPLLDHDGSPIPARGEAIVDRFIHQRNLEHFRRLLAEPDAARDRERHEMLLKLLAEEEAKDKQALGVGCRLPDA